MNKCLFPVLFISLLLLSPVAQAGSYEFGPGMTKATKKLVEQDLVRLESIRGEGATDLHKKIFGEVSGRSYIKFFSARIFSFDYRNEKDATAVVQYDPNFPQTRHRMILLNRYVNGRVSPLNRLSTLLHESVHAEPAYASHDELCPRINRFSRQPILGLGGESLVGWKHPACDTTPFGAYGVEIVFLRNIEKFCTNCSDRMKKEAGEIADRLMNRIIDRRAYEILSADR